MSLVVCLEADKAIILGADSRGTVGDPRGLTAIKDTERKIFPMGNCGLGVCGASEIGRTLLDELMRPGVENLTSIDSALSRVAKAAEKWFEEWFRNAKPEDRVPLMLTLAGYRKPKPPRHPEAKSMIYLLNSQQNFAPQLFSGICLSGIPQYAVYLAHRYYHPGISVDRAKALAEYLIAETASQDPKVGGPIRMAEIASDTGYRELSDEEVKEIHEANEDINTQLREFFLKGGVT